MEGAVGKITPAQHVNKSQGNCWMEKIIRLVTQPAHSEDKSKNTRQGCCETSLFCFRSCHLCTATKVIHKASYLGVQRLFFLHHQYPELQKLLAGYGKGKFMICIGIWLNVLHYYLKYLENKTNGHFASVEKISKSRWINTQKKSNSILLSEAKSTNKLYQN